MHYTENQACWIVSELVTYYIPWWHHITSQEEGTVVKGDEPDAPPKKVKACSLDKPTQDLIRMIFDNDMFNNAMQKLELGEHLAHMYAHTTQAMQLECCNKQLYAW